MFIRMFFILCLILTACSPAAQQTPTATSISDEDAALQTLLQFLTHLHAGNYAEAAKLYAGDYTTMQEHNPSIDAENHSALLRNACEINGSMCLGVLTARVSDRPSADELVYAVELQWNDGSRFEPGPCCGAEPGSSPPQTEFLFTMSREGGSWYVLNMPPYSP